MHHHHHHHHTRTHHTSTTTTSSNKLRVAGFLLNFAECERMIEVTRQAITCMRGFEPYSTFQRLVAVDDNPMAITPSSIDAFMRDMAVTADRSSIEMLVSMFSSKLTGILDFEDFLRLSLSREASSARFEAARREVPLDSEVSAEIEYLLSRLIAKLCDFFRKLRTDSETQTLIGESSSIFGMIGSRNLDFNTLSNFFKSLSLHINDKDIVSILRMIDINDDGIIDRAEFDYFISLVNVRNQDTGKREALSQKIKTKVRTEITETIEEVDHDRKPRRVAREEIRYTIESRTPTRSERPQASKPTISSNLGNTGAYERYRVTEVRNEPARGIPNDIITRTSHSRSVSRSATRPNREQRAIRVEEPTYDHRSSKTAEFSAPKIRDIPVNSRSDNIDVNNDQFSETNFRNFAVLRPLVAENRPELSEDRRNDTYTYKRTTVGDDKPTNARPYTPSKVTAGSAEEKRPVGSIRERTTRTEYERHTPVKASGTEEPRLGTRDFGATSDSYQVTRDSNVFTGKLGNTIHREIRQPELL